MRKIISNNPSRWFLSSRLEEGFHCDGFCPPNWKINPLAAETSPRLEEQSAGCGNFPQIGGTIRWLRKLPPDWRNNPLTAEPSPKLEEGSDATLRRKVG